MATTEDLRWALIDTLRLLNGMPELDVRAHDELERIAAKLGINIQASRYAPDETKLPKLKLKFAKPT